MEFRALLLLGFMLVESGFGQMVDANEWRFRKILEVNRNNVDQWMTDVEALDARLNATMDELTRQKAEMDQLKTENEDLKARLNATEREIDALKQSGAKATPQIAFSASLVDSDEVYQGPCTDKTLVYKRIFSNIGNGYDVHSGVFTASVNGLYYFTFSTYGYNTHTTGAILLKNNVRQVSAYDSPTVDGSDSSSNAVVLQLAAGDKVHMELWDDGRVYDNLNGHTTFSGFLLFPL